MKRWFGIGAVVAVTVAVVYTAFPWGFAVGGSGGDGLAGTYTVNGLYPGGEEYSGTARITEASGDDAYDITWTVTGSIQAGSGVLRDGGLLVEWSTISSAAGDETGTASYTVDEAGNLSGTRTIDGVDEPGTEELFIEP